MTAPARNYLGDRPSALVLMLEQRAREQRQRDLATRPTTILHRLRKLLAACFTHRDL